MRISVRGSHACQGQSCLLQDKALQLPACQNPRCSDNSSGTDPQSGPERHVSRVMF